MRYAIALLAVVMMSACGPAGVYTNGDIAAGPIILHASIEADRAFCFQDLGGVNQCVTVGHMREMIRAYRREHPAAKAER